MQAEARKLGELMGAQHNWSKGQETLQSCVEPGEVGAPLQMTCWEFGNNRTVGRANSSALPQNRERADGCSELCS